MNIGFKFYVSGNDRGQVTDIYFLSLSFIFSFLYLLLLALFASAFGMCLRGSIPKLTDYLVHDVAVAHQVEAGVLVVQQRPTLFHINRSLSIDLHFITVRKTQVAVCPILCLLADVRHIEPLTKVQSGTSQMDQRVFNTLRSSVIYNHNAVSLS